MHLLVVFFAMADKKMSGVWAYFEKDAQNEVAICKVDGCTSQPLSYGKKTGFSTSSLRRHLRHVHKIIPTRSRNIDLSALDVLKSFWMDQHDKQFILSQPQWFAFARSFCPQLSAKDTFFHHFFDAEIALWKRRFERQAQDCVSYGRKVCLEVQCPLTQSGERIVVVTMCYLQDTSFRRTIVSCYHHSALSPPQISHALHLAGNHFEAVKPLIEVITCSEREVPRLAAKILLPNMRQLLVKCVMEALSYNTHTITMIHAVMVSLLHSPTTYLSYLQGLDQKGKLRIEPFCGSVDDPVAVYTMLERYVAMVEVLHDMTEMASFLREIPLVRVQGIIGALSMSIKILNIWSSGEVSFSCALPHLSLIVYSAESPLFSSPADIVLSISSHCLSNPSLLLNMLAFALLDIRFSTFWWCYLFRLEHLKTMCEQGKSVLAEEPDWNEAMKVGKEGLRRILREISIAYIVGLCDGADLEGVRMGLEEMAGTSVESIEVLLAKREFEKVTSVPALAWERPLLPAITGLVNLCHILKISPPLIGKVEGVEKVAECVLVSYGAQIEEEVSIGSGCIGR